MPAKIMQKNLFISATLIFSFSFLPALSFTAEEKPEYDLFRKKAESLTFAQKDLERLEAFIAKYPKSPELVYLLGRYLEQNGYEGLAAEAYSKSSQLDPNFLPARFHRLISLIKIHNTEEAEKELSECLRLLKNDANGLAKLAMLLQSGGHYSLSERVFEAAADAPNAMSDLSLTVAEMRLRQGKLDDALQALDVAIRKNSQDKKAIFMKGKALIMKNETKLGMQNFQKVYEIDPCHEGVAFVIARENLKQAQYEKALLASIASLMCFQKDQYKFNEAKKQLEISLKNLPASQSKVIVDTFASKLSTAENRVFFRFAMGDIYDKQNRFDEAIDQYQLGVAESKSLNKDYASLLARGIFRWAKDEETHRNDFQKALQLYALATELKPYDQEITTNHYRLMLKMKNSDNDVAWKFKLWLRKVFP